MNKFSAILTNVCISCDISVVCLFLFFFSVRWTTQFELFAIIASVECVRLITSSYRKRMKITFTFLCLQPTEATKKFAN